jgi:NADPH:quinone reductase-like Zn-dependent oxidoreductase
MDRLKAFRVEMPEPGTLDRLSLCPFEPRPPQAGEIQIQVQALGLNLREVLRALGVYPDTGAHEGRALTFDGDCAGVVTAVGEGVHRFEVGDRVLACGPSVFASVATVSECATAAIPGDLTSAEAATIPIAFTTAHYATSHLARLQRNERILIHAATGGVGLAAVQLSQLAGAEIFATAGSDDKREFLRALGVPHVMNSRSLEFVSEIRQVTSGRGVDVVLNSLAGDFIPAGLSVLAPFGRFLEIGKRDIYENAAIGLLPFRNNLSFFAIDLQQMGPLDFAALLAEVTMMFTEGKLKPLPHRIFPIAEVTGAFRLMRRAAHIGKIVLSLEGVDPNVSSPTA